MNHTNKSFQKSSKNLYASYGLFFGLAGLFCIFFMYPYGMFSGFVLGTAGTVCGITGKSKRYASHHGKATAAVIFGLLSILLSAAVYFSFMTFFDALRDPVSGPQITELIQKILNQYGMSMEEFAGMLNP